MGSDPHLHCPAQLVRGFTLIDRLDKLSSQASSLGCKNTTLNSSARLFAARLKSVSAGLDAYVRGQAKCTTISTSDSHKPVCFATSLESEARGRIRIAISLINAKYFVFFQVQADSPFLFLLVLSVDNPK